MTPDKGTKQPKTVDLSEYSEERLPFDAVIRKLGKVKPAQHEKAKPKSAKTARKRK